MFTPAHEKRTDPGAVPAAVRPTMRSPRAFAPEPPSVPAPLPPPLLLEGDPASAVTPESPDVVPELLEVLPLDEPPEALAIEPEEPEPEPELAAPAELEPEEDPPLLEAPANPPDDDPDELEPELALVALAELVPEVEPLLPEGAPDAPGVVPEEPELVPPAALDPEEEPEEAPEAAVVPAPDGDPELQAAPSTKKKEADSASGQNRRAKVPLAADGMSSRGVGPREITTLQQRRALEVAQTRATPAARGRRSPRRRFFASWADVKDAPGVIRRRGMTPGASPGVIRLRGMTPGAAAGERQAVCYSGHRDELDGPAMELFPLEVGPP